MTVDHGAVGKVEFVGDCRGALPVKEGLVDSVALGMFADGAVGFVATERAGVPVVGFFAAQRFAIFTLGSHARSVATL